MPTLRKQGLTLAWYSDVITTTSVMQYRMRHISAKYRHQFAQQATITVDVHIYKGQACEQHYSTM